MFRQKSWRVSPKVRLTEMATATDTLSEAQFKLREIARPMWADTRHGSLTRAARTLGISNSLAERIVYAKCKRIDAHVLDNIRAAYARLEARAERLADEMEASARARQSRLKGNDADAEKPAESVPVMGRELETGTRRAHERAGAKHRP